MPSPLTLSLSNNPPTKSHLHYFTSKIYFKGSFVTRGWDTTRRFGERREPNLL